MKQTDACSYQGATLVFKRRSAQALSVTAKGEQQQ